MPGKRSSRPGFSYNSLTQRWEVIGKGGVIKASFGDDGNIRIPTTLEVGDTADKISKIYKFVATLSAAVAVPSGAVGVGTLQSLTGSGVGCAELAVSDFVFGVPKVALSSVNLGGFHIPTTNTLNIYLTGAGVNGVGSLAIMGFDCFAIR